MMNDDHTNYVNQQIDKFRRELLSMSLRNSLLNFRHGDQVKSQIRVVDELPDAVFERLEQGSEFTFLPIPEPRDQPDDEGNDAFQEKLVEHRGQNLTYELAMEALNRNPSRANQEALRNRLEREARDHIRLELGLGVWESEHGLSVTALCKRRGIDPSYDLPLPDQDETANRHHDSALQTRLAETQLSDRLRLLVDRAQSSISQSGVGTLFVAFGFLEWFESGDSDIAHHAPLILFPVELTRRLRGGRYFYALRASEEGAVHNVTLSEYIRQNFGVEIPVLDKDDSPESYFVKFDRDVCSNSRDDRWRLRRFLTIGIFSYSKLAIYEDLNPENWPEGKALAAHPNIGTLLAQSGASDRPYGENRNIDEDKIAATIPFLIYDADSSQHSAIADVLEGKNLMIYGPPGTGKSQTIANIIAAAMMVGKTVLFMAEKQTALDVVSDRLRKAGLGPFCFDLHAQGRKSGEVRRSLEARFHGPAPKFDPAIYEQQKMEWTRQRDALRDYARIMGETIGRLGLAVHEILWRVIDQGGPNADLSPAIRDVTLPDVETVTTAVIDEAQRSLQRLEIVEAADGNAVEQRAVSPWRGVCRTDLSAIDLGPARQRIMAWEQGLVNLVAIARQGMLSDPDMTIAKVHEVVRGVRTVRQAPETLVLCDLAALSGQDARDGIARAARRGHGLRQARAVLTDEHGIDLDSAPPVEALRLLARDASALAVADQSAMAVRTQATTLRDQAAARDRIEETLARIRTCLAIDPMQPISDEAIDGAIAILNDTDSDLLALRTAPLMKPAACRILHRAETECRRLKQERGKLVDRFNIDACPPPADLRQAAQDLNALRGPLFFNKPARHAMKLYRGLMLHKGKVPAAAASADLYGLANHLETAAQLPDDAEIKDCLGPHWRGLDSDLAPVRQVVDWAAAVRNTLSGVGEGWIEVSDALFHTDADALTESRRLAGTLPPDWRQLRSQPASAELRKHAAELEALAERLGDLGLAPDFPFRDAEGLADLVGAYQTLASEAAADETLARVAPGQMPDSPELDRMHALADAMSALDLPEAAWRRVADFVTRLADADTAVSELDAALEKVAAAWTVCVRELDIDEPVFFDGSDHGTTPLAALTERARDCAKASDALLPWSDRQRALAAVQQSHAAPVLTAFDQQSLSLSQIGNAYRWVLYRCLAEAVYRDYPQLRGLKGSQLADHRAAFRDLEIRLQELERQRIVYELYSRPVEPGRNLGGPTAFSERALIQHQLSLRRSSVTTRDLLRRAGAALRQAIPCFMMSPTTVAELLPRDPKLFDIVIIDEASQMLPCDALGALARGRQSVIVGDPKQLPPSTFFQGQTVADPEDEDDMLVRDVESILDLSLSAWQPPRHLLWHYRSRHSNLIQFSNVHFYDNRLIVFPGPNESSKDSGIRYHHVADGLCKSGLNPVEAEHVVRKACEFMENPGNLQLSLAIVAMNQKQRDHINEMLDREAANNPKVQRYRDRWDDSLYPLIVRNLETVQGDERDVIFISTVYGRERPGGPVIRRFGPITHQGGERRLNVLFSRARRRMDVFSSMRPNEIIVGPSTSQGVRILRDYLAYAATGRLEGGSVTGHEPESPFEAQVLKRLGEVPELEIDPQVGVGAYRIDLGIKHARWPHGYLLGVECDGATYHSALSVRDRDRLREEVLRGLGWDIYRIWSTDWFTDADRETDKLLQYVERRLERLLSEAGGSVDDEQALPGERVAERPASDLPGRPLAPGSVPPAARRLDQPLSAASGSVDDGQALPGEAVAERSVSDALGQPAALSDAAQAVEDLFVQIGDTVEYHGEGRAAEKRRVTIVTGPDDPDRGIINDSKPAAQALLGGAVGETVTIHQPTYHTDIVIDRIERPEADMAAYPAPGAVAPDHGIALAHYHEWRGDAPDPLSAPRQLVAETLFEIVKTEAPVVGGRAYQAYRTGIGGRRLGRQMRSVLNGALNDLVNRRRVTVDRAANEAGYENAVFYVSGSRNQEVRELGPRKFDQIPLAELSLLVRRVRSMTPNAPSEEIYRTVLAHYALVRMTASVESRFVEADRIPDSLF